MDRVTIADVRAAGHCVKGARRWCERHGLSFRDLCKGGIAEAEFLAKGDALAEIIVDRKRARSHG